MLYTIQAYINLETMIRCLRSKMESNFKPDIYHQHSSPIWIIVRMDSRDLLFVVNSDYFGQFVKTEGRVTIMSLPAQMS